MNCQEFELIVHEMAREEPLGAEARREGLAHISGCASCARLLATSHSLSLGLGALAAGSALTQASASVEAALLEAFERERRPTRRLLKRAGEGWGFSPAAKAPPPTEIIENDEARLSAGLKPHPPSTPLSPSSRAVRRPSPWESARWVLAKWLPAFSAVAVLAVALGVRYWHAPGEGESPRGRTSEPNALSSATGTQSTGNSELTTRAADSARQGPAGKLPSSVADATTPDLEFADFVPLPGFADPLDVEAGEVVRVSLPSSAAADLGLPVIEDGEETTIQAEVLIAEDGTARAVRIRN